MAETYYTAPPPPPPSPPVPSAPPYEPSNPHHVYHPPLPLQRPQPRPLSATLPAELPKSEHAPHTVKAVTVLSAGLYSLLTISLSYVAVLSSADIYRSSITPLVASTVFMILAIMAALYLCTTTGRLAKLAILPIIFSTVSGAMIILLNVASRALSNGGFVDINFFAVLISAAVFGGIALGATISFALFAAG